MSKKTTVLFLFGMLATYAALRDEPGEEQKLLVGE